MNQPRSKILKGLVALFGFIAICIILLAFPGTNQENSFINFSVSDLKKDNVSELIVDTKAVDLALNDPTARIVKDIPQINKKVISFESSNAATKFSEAAREQNLAASIEKDVEVHAFVSFNDTRYASQTNLAQMGMQTGWNYLNDASSVKIAIVDTGVRGTHEDLSGKVLAGYNVLTSSAIPANTNSDDHGHGTGMASLAAAIGNNGVGVVGTAYSAQVLPVKALNSAGNGSASDVATGVIWAADNGARVVNLSLGASDYSQTLHDAIGYAIGKNCLVVAASGNEGGSVSYPGRDSLVLSVGSVDSSNHKSSFSNYGSELDVVAPGESIWHASYNANNSYGQDSGTSVSAAEVSGIAALASLWHSGASATEIEGYIASSAQKLSDMNGASRTDALGYGLISYDRLQTVAGDFHYSWVSQSVYPTLDVSQSNNFILVIKNTGKSSWRSGSVNLGTSTPQDRTSAFTREGDGPSGWLTQNRIVMQESAVAPGNNATYSFWMRNDSVSPGYHQEYFRPVVDGVAWMEDIGIYWGVTVPSPADRYHYQWVGQNVYPTLDIGQSYNFQLSVRNTGTATWQRGQVNLGTSRNHDRISLFTREGSGGSGWLSPNRIVFQEDSVAPGATATYSFWMRNDSLNPGTYNEYFQLVADGLGWMEDYGIYWGIKVPTTAEKYSYQWISQNEYPALGIGQSYNFILTVKNTGSVPWVRGQVNLGTSRPLDRISLFTREGSGGSGWLSPNRIVFQEATVAPGAEATYSFWMRNDSVSPGITREYFRPVADGITWLEDYGIFWDVVTN